MKLKKVIRSGVLETNSSSSHSVCICSDPEVCKKGDKVWDLDFLDDGSVYIPSPTICFGRNLFKSNRCLMKIQYAYGLAFSVAPRRQYEITELIKKVTGAKDVKIEWVEKYKEELKKRKGILREMYVDAPEVDHQSLDLFDEIFENEDTLREFIFNPKSWLYGGSDESEDPKGFRRECFTNYDEDSEAKLTIHLGEDFIGDMDFILPDILENLVESCEEIVSEDRLSGLHLEYEKLCYMPKLGYMLGIQKDQKYIDPRILETEPGGKLVLAVFPLNESACQNLYGVPRRKHPGFPTVAEIEADSGLKANVGGGFKTYPITITSKIFGKLC